ncbi:MFS transporter [Aeromicrobium sp. NPDC092404]|uniref:MFS transporter n=1 Tax=Aeromicrobium sp. NPDC092404 TaxID=3154976 RepID=UPI003428656A
MTTTTQPAEGQIKRLDARGLGLLLVLSGALFLEGADIAMLAVALPSIGAEFDLSAGGLQWVMSAYVLGYGGFLLLGGRAADLLGRRRMFLIPLAVFVVFSGIGGLATESWMLVVARFVTGVAAAFMTPAGLSIITTGYAQGAARQKALLIYGAAGAAGYSLGLVLGGLLTLADWRWVFFAPVIMSAVILAFATRLVPPDSVVASRAVRQLDLTGAVALAAGLLLLVNTLERASHTSLAWTLTSGLGAVAALAAFVAIERRVREPLVRLGIFRAGSVIRVNLVALLFSAAFFSFQFVIVLYLQELRGWSTLETSLALLIMAIDGLLAPTLTPWVVTRFGHASVLTAGVVAQAVSFLLFLPMTADWSYYAMLPGLVAMGLAFTLAYGTLAIAATDGVDDSEHGLAGGLLYTAFQVGAALGLAVVSAALVALADGGATGLDDYRAALLVPLVAAIVAVGVSLVHAVRKPPSTGAAG